MTNEARRFIYFFSENATHNTLKQYREIFNKLSMEDQYEVLCECAQSISYPQKNKGMSLKVLFRKNEGNPLGKGIIDIVNHIFPQGATIEQIKQNMPEELYNQLAYYEGDMKRLIDNLHAFRNENGEISEEKVTAFLSNSNVRVHTGTDLKNVFEHVNPDKGMDGIQRIIAGRIESICKEHSIRQGERRGSN